VLKSKTTISQVRVEEKSKEEIVDVIAKKPLVDIKVLKKNEG